MTPFNLSTSELGALGGLKRVRGLGLGLGFRLRVKTTKKNYRNGGIHMSLGYELGF